MSSVSGLRLFEPGGHRLRGTVRETICGVVGWRGIVPVPQSIILVHLNGAVMVGVSPVSVCMAGEPLQRKTIHKIRLPCLNF